jgi:two-component system sensor histidine kinase ChvG
MEDAARPVRRQPQGSWVIDRRDEIGALSQDLQELVDRLHGRLEETARIAGDLAHDLKNPIATVRASAEILQSTPREIDRDRLTRVAGALGDAAAHMNRSVDGLLKLARLEESLAGSQRVVVPLADLLAPIANGLPAAGSAISVERRIAAGAEAASVVGIPERLTQMIQNLVDNAVVFAARRVWVALDRRGDSWLVSVSDDGPGVSAGNRAKIFQRFFSTRPEGAPEGTGLGLVIARAIARSHGGEVELVEHGPLPGACFVARLPAA